MNTVAKYQPALPTTPRDYTGSQLSLIKRTVAKDCNNDEFDLFMEVCRRAGFDPFRKQVYAFVFSKDKPDKRQLAIVTGIDGYRVVAARNRDYRPDEKPARITYDEALKNPDTNPLGIEKAVVSAYRFAEGGWHELSAEAYWDEFAPIEEEYDWVDTGEVWQDSGKPKKTKRPTGKAKLAKDSWRKMARVMISKCAEAQALRKGWPEELSGIYTDDEMEQAFASDRTASQTVEIADQERREALVHAKDAVPLQWKAGEDIVYETAGGLADKILEHIGTITHPMELTKWNDINRVGLQQFWSAAPSDALEVKKAIEARQAELDRAAGQQTPLDGG